MMSNIAELGDRLLVIFDGHCGLCNRTIRWLMRRDSQDRLRFVAFESPQAAGLLTRHGISLPDAKIGPATILVVREFGHPAEQVLTRSDALLVVLRELPQPWPAVAVLLGCIPRTVRDMGYRLVARWRYRIWGRQETCPASTAENHQRL